MKRTIKMKQKNQIILNKLNEKIKELNKRNQNKIKHIELKSKNNSNTNYTKLYEMR